MKRTVIIGGVAGGASCATRLRRLTEDMDIVMLERGPYVSFANCGLPYYVGNVIKDQKSLELVSPTRFLERFAIDVRVNHEATSIDRENKKINIRDKEKQQDYTIDYDHLVLSTGSTPIKPPIQGIDDVPVFVLWTIPDAVKIKEYVDAQKVKHATIIGGGLIGLEMAENLVKKGIKVKIIEMQDQVLPSYDKEMAQFVHQELILNGVCLVLSDPVDSFGRNEQNKTIVTTKTGRNIETDLIILAIGIKPTNQLAKAVNLKLGERGHVIVDKNMRTSDPSIFAVGDVVEVQHFITHKQVAMPLAGPANKQGRIAADVIVGKDSEYDGILGANVVKVFDLTVASVGLTEKMLKESNLNYEKVYLHPNNHAGYYPGAVPMTIKLLFEVYDPIMYARHEHYVITGKILGTQIVGGQGSEKRVDVISTLIRMGGTVYDLEKLELTYAPPFSSAKDPANMAGFIASNFLKGDMPLWQWHNVNKIKEENGILLDVRTPQEYNTSTIKESINIPLHELRDRIDELPKDKLIVVFCQVGYRSYLAIRILKLNGYKDVYELTGGFKLYEMANMTVEEIVGACGSSDVIMETFVEEKSVAESEDIVMLDTSGLSCPGPLNAMIKGLEKLPEDKKLKVYATDPGFKASVEAYAQLSEAVKLLSIAKEQGKIVALLQKEAFVEADVSAPVKTYTRKRKELRGPDAPAVTDIEADELYGRLDTNDSPALLIDVRTLREYNSVGGHIDKTKHIPLGELMESVVEIEKYKDEEVVTICHSGARSNMAAQLLAREGFKDLRNLKGGMVAWHRKGYPVDKEKKFV